MPVGICTRRTADSTLLTFWPPAPLRAHQIDAHIAFLEIDLNRIINDGVDRDRGEAGMPPRVGIIRRNPDKAMHTGFGLGPAIGVAPLDEQRGGFDARFFAVGDFHHLDLEAGPFRPAGIHAQQHRGPILALGAASAGMHFDIGVVGIGFAGQQRLDLPLLRLGFKRTDLRFTFLDRGLIALGLAEFDQRLRILEIVLDLVTALSLYSRSVRSRISFCAVVESFQKSGSSTRRSAPGAAALPCPSQRCLLSSPTDCWMASTIATISVRIIRCSDRCARGRVNAGPE